MKQLAGAFIALSFAATALMAWGDYSGRYHGFPFDDDFQFPSYDEGGQARRPQETPPQPPTTPRAKPAPSFTSLEQQHPNLIIMFTKDECPYCRYMKPIMKAVEMKYGNDIKFLYVDVVQHPHYAAQYGFTTVPQIVYFKDGKRLEMHGSGNKTMTKEQVEAKIKTHFGETSSEE
jgi:thiol-disulfide isomerase/thioredoxin